MVEEQPVAVEEHFETQLFSHNFSHNSLQVKEKGKLPSRNFFPTEIKFCFSSASFFTHKSILGADNCSRCKSSPPLILLLIQAVTSNVIILLLSPVSDYLTSPDGLGR